MKYRSICFVFTVFCSGACSAYAQSSFPNGFTLGNPTDAHCTSWLTPTGSRRTTSFGSENGGLMFYSNVKETSPGAWDGGIALFGNPLTFVASSSASGGTFDVWNANSYGGTGALPVFRIDTVTNKASFNTLDVAISNGSLSVAGSPVITANTAAATLTSQGFLLLSGGTVGIGSTTSSTSSSTGALTVSGGIGVMKDSFINGLRIGRGNNDVATNSAFGEASLGLASGGDNTAVGYKTLEVNLTGSANTAIGARSLNANTTGVSNTSVGHASLQSNTAGSLNTVSGESALSGNVTGSSNVSIGANSGKRLVGGGWLGSPENSVYIGMNSAGKDDNDDNSIVIGANAVGEGANTTVIGNSNTVKTRLHGETNTPSLRVAGAAVLEGSVILVQPQGDISMGVYE